MIPLVAQRRAIRGPWSGPLENLDLAEVEALFELREPRSGSELADADVTQPTLSRVVARRWARSVGGEPHIDADEAWTEQGWLRARLFMERVYQEKLSRADDTNVTESLPRRKILSDYRSVVRALGRTSAYQFARREIPDDLIHSLCQIWSEDLRNIPGLRLYLARWQPDDSVARALKVRLTTPWIEDLGRSIYFSDLDAIAQGQKWTTRGSGGVLFVAVDLASLASSNVAASDYFEMLLNAGRIGQRTVVLLEQLGMCGRMTPALDEQLACDAMGLLDIEPLYLLRFGFPPAQ